MLHATLLVVTDAGRASLFARAQDSLGADEVVVQVKDLIGRRRAFRTTPCSARAQLLATEPPLVMRGGLTQIISYFRVPAHELAGREAHFDRGVFSHAYDVQLRVACHGRREERRAPA